MATTVLTLVNLQSSTLPSKALGAASSRRPHMRRASSRSLSCAIVHAAARRRRYTATRTVVVESAASSELASVRVRLPATLARPIFKSIDSQALASVDPSLSSTPLEYVKDRLCAVGPSMLSAAASAKPVHELGSIDQHIDVTIGGDHSHVPTHMLAVWSKSAQNHGLRKVELFPVHDIVLAASCANMPPLQTTSRDAPADPSTVRLPVVPICVPHRETFALLQQYLYTRQSDRLLACLLPGTASDVQPEDVARHYAETCSLAVLMQHAMQVHGLWSNACVLGVFDESLWRVLDVSWALLMESLRLAQASSMAGQS